MAGGEAAAPGWGAAPGGYAPPPGGYGPAPGGYAPPPAANAPPASWYFQQGEASYYTDALTGNPTASGEPYEPWAFTAAHRTLPLGSVVDVVRPDGRYVRVRVNDRGPYAKGRIIDLSRRAAEVLGMVNEGVAEVFLRIIYVPPPRPQRTSQR
jgi:rare lipoprotein A